MSLTIGDYPSTLLYGLSDFWQRFFRDVDDIQSFYQAAEISLGDAYLDLLATVLNTGIVDTPLFDKESWRLFRVRENDLRFKAGLAVAENRYFYDMPHSAVNIEFLQNTIFDPTIELEKDVDFEVKDNDGYVRFVSNPFEAFQDSAGEWFPAKGLAWRYQTIETGNKFTDRARGAVHWDADTDVRVGDTLRVLAYPGVTIYDSVWDAATNGQLVYVAPDMTFLSFGPTGFDPSNLGDIIKIKGSGTHDGYYVIAEYLSPISVRLENAFYAVTSSSGWVSWELHKGVYFKKSQEDHRIDYIDKNHLVGARDDAFPTEYNTPYVYSVVRERAEPPILGYPLAGPIPGPAFMDPAGDPLNQLSNDNGHLRITLDAFTPFVIAMVGASPPWGITFGAPYRKSFRIVEVTATPTGTALLDGNPADFGLNNNGDSMSLPCAWAVAQAPPPTNLGARHIVPGSLCVYANRIFGGVIKENEDYIVDYYRGRLVPTKPWGVSSSNHVAFQYMHEVLFSASGEAYPMTEGKVKEISYWVPQVQVDNFSLYYNYGSMLNRFQASSESYKVFLRGVMHFYVHGPILQRIESALNVISDFPVVRFDGEVLQSYSDGIDFTGVDGTIVAASREFSTPSYAFSELDVGGYVVIVNATEPANRGSFRILNVVSSDTVELETTYGFVDETPVEWWVSRENRQTVVTDLRTYYYPLRIPVRDDVKDVNNVGALTFSAFEPLTVAFGVVDYLIDPAWWHNQSVPAILWSGQSAMRRLASTALFEHVYLPADDARYGDPGLYYAADDQGNVSLTTSAYRHCVAFILFDQYLKMHMFNVEIAPHVEMDVDFHRDLEELILVSKPSYTYPYVKPGQSFMDVAMLTEVMSWLLGVHSSEDMQVADTYLKYGSYLTYGDYYTYDIRAWAPSGVASPPAPGPNGPMPLGPDEYIVRINLDATVDGGNPVFEGIHYTFEFDPTSPDAWTFTPDLVNYSWDVAANINFQAIVVQVDTVTTPPDTRLGYTPLFHGGLEPLYPTQGPPKGTEHIDRAVTVAIDDGGASYTYP